MKVRFGYVTDDVNNIHKNALFRFLSQRVNIKLITTSSECTLYKDSEIIELDTKKSFKDYLKSKLFFISSLCNSKYATLYHKRNLHLNHRYFVNMLHFTKRILSILNLLPSYSFIIECIYRKDKQHDTVIKQFDYIIFDSLLINNNAFHSFLGRAAHLNNIKLIADIYSWDNVHYSTITYFADYYLLWNKELRTRLLHDHPCLVNKQFRYVGAQYMNYLQELVPVKNDTENYILFAAVYCDERTASIEKKIVLRIADLINHAFKDLKLYFRPYPSMDKKFYEELYLHPSIEVKEFGILRQRYSNEKEIIRIDNNLQDKLNLIYNAKAFISLGSTFTFEVGYLMKPIIQLNLLEPEFSIVRQKTKTADHIIGSFLTNNNNVVTSIEELKEFISDILRDETKFLEFSKYLKNFVNIDNIGNYSVFENRLSEIVENENE